MSRFSGHMGNGAMKAHRAQKRREAYNRGLAIWNDGTGLIHINPAHPDSLDYEKRVANPKIYLKISERES